MEEEVKRENEEEKLDYNAKDIIKKASKENNLSEAEIKKLLSEINESFDFDKLLEELKSKYSLKGDKYVIFTNGKEQLYYEDGEFFVISAVDSKSTKKKIKRKEALDLYNEYYITNILNPLLKQKQVDKINVIENTDNEERDIDRENITRNVEEDKVQQKENITQDIKNQINDLDTDETVKERLEKLKEKEEEIKQKRKVNEKENKIR